MSLDFLFCHSFHRAHFAREANWPQPCKLLLFFCIFPPHIHQHTHTIHLHIILLTPSLFFQQSLRISIEKICLIWILCVSKVIRMYSGVLPHQKKKRNYNSFCPMQSKGNEHKIKVPRWAVMSVAKMMERTKRRETT